MGKWPLKPGVLVHSKQQLLKLQSTNLSQSGNIVDNGIGSNENEKNKSKKNNLTCKAKSSTDNIVLTNETQSARAARIRRMMIGSNNNLQKKLSPTSPPPAPPIRGNVVNSANNAEQKYHSETGRHSFEAILKTYFKYILQNGFILFN